MLEREEKEQEIGNLSEKMVKENFPNLVKEIDMQVQEMQKVPIMMDAKRPTPRHIIIERPKVKDKERLLKARAPWLVWLSGLNPGLQTKESPVQFLVRAHALVAGQVPGWGHGRGNQLMYLSHINVSLSLFLPPFPSL